MISIESFPGMLPATDSPSPVHSSEESSYHGLEAYDDLDATLIADDGEDASKRKSRGRGASTAERRATHNAVERARRETLNVRFMELAAALPNMSNVKRPSKSAIVNKSIEFVRTSQAREAALASQNDALRLEVNELRARLGLGPLQNTPASVAAPLSTGRNREHSIGSSSGKTDSTPLLSGSPSPNATHYELSGSPLPSAPAQLTSFSPNFMAAAANTANLMCGLTTPASERKLSFPGPAEGIAPQVTTATVNDKSMPAGAPFVPGHFNPLDLGYLMGLQHSAAQVQTTLAPALSALTMQTGLANGFGTWQNPFPHTVGMPSAGNDGMNWLFA